MSLEKDLELVMSLTQFQIIPQPYKTLLMIQTKKLQKKPTLALWWVSIFHVYKIFLELFSSSEWRGLWGLVVLSRASLLFLFVVAL